MRFTSIQTFLVILSMSWGYANNSSAQDVLKEKVSIDVADTSLEYVLNLLEKEANVNFTYSNQKISTGNKVSLTVKNRKLNKVLHQLFSPFSIEFKVFNDRTIVLTKSSFRMSTNEDDRIVTGRVVDETGIGLIGANVYVKGTSRGTVTDLDGNYSLNIPDAATTLVFSYTGFNDAEVEVGNLSVVNVTLSEGVALESVTVLGSRGKPRTDVDRPVPIDVVSAIELRATGQPDIGQSLHFTAPSFSAVKFGINDLAPLVDPASLRGLSPDQTLLLVNGKRRHKVAFFSNNSGVGKGQLANDINSIPAAAVKRVEILRDGAAAQYGSDAIAGVMNMQLNDSRSGGNINMYYGAANTSPTYDDITNVGTAGEKIYGDDAVVDGQTFSASANFGMGWGDDGFVNTTLYYSHAEPTDRSGTYSHSSGWYTDAQVEAAGVGSDEELQRINGINPDGAVLGTAESTNIGLFVNAGRAMNENWDFYTFVE